MLTPRSRDEHGSMIIAIMVLMIVVTLSVAVVSRTLVSQHGVRQNQDFNAALAQADGGVSDALFQLDQGQSGTFTNSGTSGGNIWNYKATQVDANSYTIQSVGTVNGRPHQVVANVSRVTRFDYSLFGVSSISITGNCNKGQVQPGVKMGSGGSINNDCGVQEDCFLPGNGPCPSLPNGHIIKQTHPEPLPTAPPGASSTCASGTVTLGPTLNGNGGTPLVYTCGNITFRPDSSGNVNVTNGPFILYILGSATLTFTNDTYNPGGSPPPNCQNTPYVPGCAANFQVYDAETASWTFNGHAPTIYGAVYVPGVDVTADGGKLNINGSMVAHSFTWHGAPNMGLADPSLTSVVVQNWTISNYHEAASTCTSNC
jgi:Tfp pilus assembly protein PilX